MQGPQRHTMLVGGSRSGKTFLIVRQIVNRALIAEQSRHVVLRYRGNAAWASIGQDTLPKVVREGFPGLTIHTVRGNYVQLPNGSQIWIGGLGDQDQVEKLLGNEYATLLQ
jgi:hypothetical protein